MIPALSASVFALGLAANLVSAAIINTPAALVQCQNVQLSWTGAQGQVFISLIPGGQAGAEPLKKFDGQTGESGAITWQVDRPVGESITVQINDQTGIINYSKAVTVQSGIDSKCIGNGTVSGSAPATGAAASSNKTPVAVPATAAPGTDATAGNDDEDDKDDDAAPATAAAAVGNAANRTASAINSAANATANATGAARNASAVLRNATTPAQKDSGMGIVPPSTVYALGAAILIGTISAFAL